MERVAISYSWGSSLPRDQTWVSYIGRWIFFLTTAPPGKPISVDEQQGITEEFLSWAVTWLDLPLDIFHAIYVVGKS